MRNIFLAIFSLMSVFASSQTLTKSGTLFTVTFADGSINTYTLPHNEVSKGGASVIVNTQSGDLLTFFVASTSCSGCVSLQTLYEFCLYDNSGGGGDSSLWENFTSSQIQPKNDNSVIVTNNVFIGDGNDTLGANLNIGEITYDIFSLSGNSGASTIIVSDTLNIATTTFSINSTVNLDILSDNIDIETATIGITASNVQVNTDTTTVITGVGTIDYNESMSITGGDMTYLFTPTSAVATYAYANGENSITLDSNNAEVGVQLGRYKYIAGAYNFVVGSAELSINDTLTDTDRSMLCVRFNEGLKYHYKDTLLFQIDTLRNAVFRNMNRFEITTASNSFTLDEQAVGISIGNTSIGIDADTGAFEISNSDVSGGTIWLYEDLDFGFKHVNHSVGNVTTSYTVYDAPAPPVSTQIMTMTTGGQIGYTAMIVGTSAFTIDGDNNMYAGTGALAALTDGVQNHVVGINAAGTNTTGNANTVFGYLAFVGNTVGENNTAIGTLAGANCDGDNNVYLGSTADGGGVGINGQTALGANTACGGFKNTVALGIGAQNTTDYQLYVSDSILEISINADIILRTDSSVSLGGANQFINVRSGTYTPTLANVTNVAASTARLSTYSRLGNMVTITGQFDIDPTLALTATVLGISLPIASNFTTVFEGGGGAWSTAIASESAGCQANATTDVLEIRFICTDATNHTMSFQIGYEVK